MHKQTTLLEGRSLGGPVADKPRVHDDRLWWVANIGWGKTAERVDKQELALDLRDCRNELQKTIKLLETAQAHTVKASLGRYVVKIKAKYGWA